MTFVLIFIGLQFCTFQVWANNEATPLTPANPSDSQIENRIEIDKITDACLQKSNRDQICDALIQIRQIGNDAIEAVKAFVQLNPTEYALLTVANAAATGRVRVRGKSLFVSDATDTLDFTKDGVMFLIEKNF